MTINEVVRDKLVGHEEKDEYERCVLCQALTKTLKGTPINQRIGYYGACGQLCRSCMQRLLQETQ